MLPRVSIMTATIAVVLVALSLLVRYGPAELLPVSTDAPVARATATEPDQPDLSAPGYMDAMEGPRTEPLLGGQLLFRSFYSPILDRRMPYSIYLPPGYEASHQRYPALYMLHGYFGNYVEWADVGIHQAADRLILAGTIQPLIIVMPEGEQSYYVNHGPTGPRWGDYVIEDVVATIDGSYRTVAHREARAVGGLSMGGNAALHLAFRYPEVFGVVGGHSPTLRWDRPEDKFWFADDAYYAQVNPLELARSADRLDTLRIWLDVGDDDWNWFWVAELHDELEARAIDHQFTFFPGGHDADYWIEYQPRYLEFYDQALSVVARE